MRRILILMVLTSSLLLATACSENEERWTVYTAEAVYIESPNSVSIMVRYPNSHTLQMMKLYDNESDIIFTDDITEPNAFPWVAVIEKRDMGSWTVENIVVHIHGLTDVRPGHWDNGKFGQGNLQQVY